MKTCVVVVAGWQIKLLGDNASLILCAEGADVEARTYGTWGVVSSSPASPGASAFRSVRQTHNRWTFRFPANNYASRRGLLIV